MTSKDSFKIIIKARKWSWWFSFRFFDWEVILVVFFIDKMHIYWVRIQVWGCKWLFAPPLTIFYCSKLRKSLNRLYKQFMNEYLTKPLTMARPMPLLDPVTTATFVIFKKIFRPQRWNLNWKWIIIPVGK